jgi:hypothetical protein
MEIGPSRLDECFQVALEFGHLVLSQVPVGTPELVSGPPSSG